MPAFTTAPSLAGLDRVVHAFSGELTQADDETRLAAAVGAELPRARLRQVHGAEVIRAEEAVAAAEAPAGDALLSDRPGVASDADRVARARRGGRVRRDRRAMTDAQVGGCSPPPTLYSDFVCVFAGRTLFVFVPLFSFVLRSIHALLVPFVLKIESLVMNPRAVFVQ